MANQFEDDDYYENSQAELQPCVDKFKTVIERMIKFLKYVKLEERVNSEKITEYTRDNLCIVYGLQNLTIFPLHKYYNLLRDLLSLEDFQDMATFVINFAGVTTERTQGVQYHYPELKRFFSLPFPKPYYIKDSEDPLFLKKQSMAFGYNQMLSGQMSSDDIKKMHIDIHQLKYVGFELQSNPDDPKTQTWFVVRQYLNGLEERIPIEDIELLVELYMTLESAIEDSGENLDPLSEDEFSCDKIAMRISYYPQVDASFSDS
jgi:hypothetical protein